MTFCQNIIDVYVELESPMAGELPPPLLSKAKRLGFSDKQIASVIKSTEIAIRTLRHQHSKLLYHLCCGPVVKLFYDKNSKLL